MEHLVLALLRRGRKKKKEVLKLVWFGILLWSCHIRALLYKMDFSLLGDILQYFSERHQIQIKLFVYIFLLEVIRAWWELSKIVKVLQITFSSFSVSVHFLLFTFLSIFQSYTEDTLNFPLQVLLIHLTFEAVVRLAWSR